MKPVIAPVSGSMLRPRGEPRRRVGQRQTAGAGEAACGGDVDAGLAIGDVLPGQGARYRRRHVADAPGEGGGGGGALVVRRRDGDVVAPRRGVAGDRAGDHPGVRIDRETLGQVGRGVGQRVAWVRVREDLRGVDGRDGVAVIVRSVGDRCRDDRRLVGGGQVEDVGGGAPLPVVHADGHGVEAAGDGGRGIVVQRAGDEAGRRIDREGRLEGRWHCRPAPRRWDW